MTDKRRLEQGGPTLLAARLWQKQAIVEQRYHAWLAALRSTSEFTCTVRTGGQIVRLSLPAAEAC